MLRFCLRPRVPSPHRVAHSAACCPASVA